MLRPLLNRARVALGAGLVTATAVATCSPADKPACATGPAISLEQAAESFRRDGYVVLSGFASPEECQGMLLCMARLIDEWEPGAEKKMSVFRTDAAQESAQGSDDYFLSSADKVRFFLEPGAADEATGALRPGVEKATALNKVGHALHELVPAFRDYAHSAKVQRLVGALGLRAPDLVQSMYIFKQPRIGAPVTPHQDSCFLKTEPLSCVGLWLALEPADESNGCLWTRPGSHREPLRRHFAREVPVSQNAGGRPGEGKMGFVPMAGSEGAEAGRWEGGLPDGVSGPAELGFVPVVAEAGDLVVIHGQVDHCSLPNTSGASRHTFQLHLVEGREGGAMWDERNWLAYPPGKPFPKFGEAETAA